MKTTTKKAPAKRAATAKPPSAKPTAARPAAPKKAAPKPVAGSTAGAPPVRLSKIGLVILYVKDPIASLAFYRDVLGMTVLEQSPEWAELDAGGMHLALHSHPSIPADRGSACSWVVFSVDDVFATYRALLARGVKFLGEPKQVCGDEKKAGMSADLKDPDGNPLSLFGFVTKK